MKKVLSFVLTMAMVLGCISMAFATAEPFADAKDNIEMTILRDLDVLLGDENGNVNLENTISRAEICAILIRVLGYEDFAKSFMNGTSEFTDVEPGTWYNGYVNLAYQLGYVDGVGNNKFNPGGRVSYEEGVAFIVKALGYKESTLELSWPYNFVFFAQRDLKLVDGSIAIGTILTRGQLFDILFNAMDIKTVHYYETATTKGYASDGKTFAEYASGVDGTVASVGSGAYTTGRAVVTKEMAENAANATYGSVTLSKYIGKYCELLYKDGKVLQLVGVVDGSDTAGEFKYNLSTGEITFAGKSAGKTISLADENAWKNFYINGDVAGKTSEEAIENVESALKAAAQSPKLYAIDSANASYIASKDGKTICSFAAIDIWQRTASSVVEESDVTNFKNGSYASASAVFESAGLKFKSKKSGNSTVIDGLTVEGAVNKLNLIQEGDVLCIYSNVNKEITKIYVTRNVKVTTYEGFYKKGSNTYYIFSGKNYTLAGDAMNLSKNGAYSIEKSSAYVGSQYAIYLNRDGELAAYKNTYEGTPDSVYTTGYAVITKLSSTTEGGAVGILPVQTGIKNNIELLDLESGKTLSFAAVSCDGMFGRHLVGQVGEHAYLFSTWLTGWEVSFDTLQATITNAQASDVKYIVEYEIKDGELNKLSAADDYTYGSSLSIKASGLSDGSKFYPFASDVVVVDLQNADEVKNVKWLGTLGSFSAYYHVSKYGFVDQIVVTSSEEAEAEYDVISVAAVESIRMSTKKYVTLFTGSAKSSEYELDSSNPNIGDIYVNISVKDGVAQMAGSRNLVSVIPTARFSSGASVKFAESGDFTNVFDDLILRATCESPSIWVYDADEYEYSVFKGSVEDAYKKIESETGFIAMYDLDKNGIVEFIVVYPN